MKRKFTKLMAAFALLAFLAIPMGMRGQTSVTWPGTTALPGTATAVANDQNVTIMVSSTNTYSNPIRIYANTTVTINALNNAKILSVAYEASSTGNYVTYAQGATVTPNVTPTVNGKIVTWTYAESANVTEFTFKPSSQTRSNGITITYIMPGANPTCATPTFNPAAGTYTSAQTVTISCSTEGATIYYTTDGNDPITSSTVYSDPINVSSDMTIKAMATAEGYDNSAVATAEYAFITLEHAGTLADPYNVADARAAIDANAGTQDVYATGIVSAIPTAYDSGFGNITFDLVDEEGDEVFLQAYRCTGDEAPNVTVGDVAVVYGNLTKYGQTYEFAQGCVLVSLTHPETTEPSITVTPTTVNFAATTGAEGFLMENLTIAYENIEVTNYESFTVQFYDNQGNETEMSWLVAGVTGSNAEGYVVRCVAGDNDGEARTVYFKVYAYDADNNKVYSELVTVNQAEYVAPTYAALPFEFNGGRADIEGTDGLYQEGLGSDYSSAPKLKFDGTGDWLLLQFDERPGTLTFNIKNNSFSGGTFTVQTSEDGVTYTDLETYTEIEGTQNEEFTNLGENVRYIKWVYTNKVLGNVGLGNIALDAYEVPVTVPYITITPDNYELDANAHMVEHLTILAYENIVIVPGSTENFGIQYCDAEGNPTEHSWCGVSVSAVENSDDFQLLLILASANDSDEARTAYFKVFGHDAEDNVVYSNLVSITQAAPVIDYVVLPFEWAGGERSAFEALNGTSTHGVGDYAETQGIYRMKLDNDGDYIQVKCDQQPGKVTIGVKMIGGGNTSTITIQGSADGETFTDIETLTISGASNDILTLETTNVFGENDRYVRMVFTKGSNVGVGPITIEKGNAPSITVTPSTVDLEAAGQVGEAGYQMQSLTVTYNNLEITKAQDFAVQFYNAEGEEQTQPSWIEPDPTVVSGGNDLGYMVMLMIAPNEGPARSAYFKVYALGEEDYVYSNLVTINQAAAPAPAITLTFDDDPHSYTPESPYQIVFSEWSDGGPVVRVEYDNFPFALGAQDFQIQHCNADGEATDVIPDWFISNTPEVILFSDNLLYVKVEVSANEGDARTAYFKVWAYDENQHPVYSDLVTVTQAAPVVDYAVLPFNYEGGVLSDFSGLNGTSYSLDDNGSYAVTNAPYRIKFTKTGDYLQVKCNEQPGKVTIGVKVFNSSNNNSKITVQGSADGQSFTDIEELTIDASIVGVKDLETTANFDATHRYVRLLFTRGVNVGVGPITIAKVVPYITLVEGDPDPYQLEYSAGSHGVNAAGVNYGGFEISGETPFSIEYCDENGDPIPAWPNWLSFEVVPAYTWWTYSPYVLTGNIQQNDNASPRTAYFKVKAQNGAATVYSDIVTLRQAGMHDLNVTLADNVNAIFVFDAADQNNPLIADGAAGTVRVSGGISILVSPDVAEGYVLESLMINNENVISQLDESGAYTFTMPEGDVTITATAVEYVPAANQYVKVTTAADLTSGQYLIVYEDGSLAFDGSLETLDAEGNTFEVVINGDRIDINNITAESEFTIDMTEGTIRSASGYYIGRTVDDNGIQSSLTVEYVNTISIDEAGNANVVSSGGAYLRYNVQAERFRYYKSGTYAGQEAIQLYKKVGDAPASETYILENITGYSGEKDNYSLIASPVYVRPANVEGMITGDYDLYYFDQEQEKEWRNYEEKRFYIVPGMGYLYAKKATTETAAYNFEFEGTPYNGDGEVALKYIENAQFPGFNLIGNPFGKKATLSLPHYSLNEEGSALNANLEETEVEVMEGVFVQASVAGQSALFTPVTRGNHAAIAHTNIMLSNNMGSMLDNAIIRFDNGAMLGKFQLNPNSTTVYFTEGNHDYAIVSSEAQGEMPVNFKAENNGIYTIAVEPKNVEMTYLHLIDNMTGADIDMLQTPSYTFEAKTNDYASRFRLVFSANEGSNENATETFAFFNGSEWQISNVGEATLQVVDMMGRVLSSETISGNAEVNINQAAGIYMLRLVNGDDVKVQKVVVK